MTSSTAKKDADELLFDASDDDVPTDESLPADWEKDLQAELDGVDSDGLDIVNDQGGMDEKIEKVKKSLESAAT